MRLLIVTAALVWSPALAASPPLCTLPAPGTILLADHLAEGPAEPSPPPTSADSPSPLPEALASMPFVQRVASAGAVVRDLGSSHGMHAIAARSGDQFMLFQVTPDGGAAVSGQLLSWSRRSSRRSRAAISPISACSTDYRASLCAADHNSRSSTRHPTTSG
jgi:thiol:disulfide interchange protein DsbG